MLLNRVCGDLNNLCVGDFIDLMDNAYYRNFDLNQSIFGR